MILTFINSIEKNIENFKEKILELEDIDNLIFNSFLNSTNQFNSKLSQYKYFCNFTSNDFNEVNFLLQNYKNIKLIYIKRDLVSASYANTKRILSKNSNINLATKHKIKGMMFLNSYSRKIKEKIFFDNLNSIPHNNKFITINFNDLFTKRSEVMCKISDFLGIKFETSMMEPHMIDTKIENIAFHKENMNDSPDELFSKNELSKISSIINSNYKLFLINLFYKYVYRIFNKFTTLN